jgi:hypothetical protein
MSSSSENIFCGYFCGNGRIELGKIFRKVVVESVRELMVRSNGLEPTTY